MVLTAEFYKNKARDELRESEEVKIESLKKLREWITKHPHILNSENFGECKNYANSKRIKFLLFSRRHPPSRSSSCSQIFYGQSL